MQETAQLTVATLENGNIVFTNNAQTATFVRVEGGFRPEWFRAGERAMLRFKDHEWLNIGGIRVTAGELSEQTPTSCLFGGRVLFAGTPVDWRVRVSLPADGKSGFLVMTGMVPTEEPIEVLEALTTFETPYEYDGNEHAMTFIAQQPVYRYAEGKEINGAGYMTPMWYYSHAGKAHLTYACSSPLLAYRITQPDGGNERCVMILGNWDVCAVHDIFAQPTRKLSDKPEDVPFPQGTTAKPGCRGMKFLVGAVNWNNSLHKDPNVLVEKSAGLRQEQVVDYLEQLPDGQWDGWLATGWERLAALHFPRDGIMPAYRVARSAGASWVEAAEWLSAQFVKEEGCPGFFNPERGPCVYAPGTRPKWDNGVPFFAGQWTGPLAYLGHVWDDEAIAHSADRLEAIFCHDMNPSHQAEAVWTIGPTPMYCAVMRKAALVGAGDAVKEMAQQYVSKRAQVILNPAPGGRRGDPGIFAWDAFSNLLAADLFNKEEHEGNAKQLLAHVNSKLDSEFWSFNCAAEGDLVGAGQSRPFGHAIAATANILAWKHFGDPGYLTAAERFGNLLLAMHYITYNESPAPDLDTRGWAHGSTGGRDQWAQLPPWETGHAIQQFANLLLAGKGREGYYDVLWYFSHSGLAQFPRARTMKRLYRADMSITYRNIHELPTEREFYLSLPYLAYENPWDQTMLAGYQGVEPIILSLFFGGGLVASTNEQVMALVPAAPAYVPEVGKRFTVELWNPLQAPVETRLVATIAAKRHANYACSGALSGTVTPENPTTEALTVPPRQVTKVEFTLAQ